jgi:hypothetical protein
MGKLRRPHLILAIARWGGWVLAAALAATGLASRHTDCCRRGACCWEPGGAAVVLRLARCRPGRMKAPGVAPVRS